MSTNDFQNSEPPIICYKYNKPFRDIILISINLCLIFTINAPYFKHEQVIVVSSCGTTNTSESNNTFRETNSFSSLSVILD